MFNEFTVNHLKNSGLCEPTIAEIMFEFKNNKNVLLKPMKVRKEMIEQEFLTA